MALPSEKLQAARQRDAVAKLVSYNERMISEGLLDEATELRVRMLCNSACVTFGMDSIAEREIQVGDHDIEISRVSA